MNTEHEYHEDMEETDYPAISKADTNQSRIPESEIQEGFRVSASAISAGGSKVENENFRDELTTMMLEGVHDLPEKLAHRLGTVDPEPYLKEALRIRQLIEKETDLDALSVLQQELIFEYIAIISRVQNGGEIAITPAVAEEVNGLDCSLSSWCLKEKLQGVPHLQYAFGYPRDHAVGIVTLANGQTMYVDAQNGFMSEVTLQEVKDEHASKTAYPIVEVVESRIIEGKLPNEGTVRMTNPNGCDYMPKHLGIREDGLLHTLGNFHMFTHPTSPIFFTKAGERFRTQLGIRPINAAAMNAFKESNLKAHDRFIKEGKNDNDLELFLREEMRKHYPEHYREADNFARESHEAWERFNNGTVQSIASGITLYDTKFDRLTQEHHDAWKAQQLRLAM